MSSVPMNQHQRFQVHLRELCEGAAHAGQSEFCFPFSLDPIASNAGKVWPLCSNLLILRTLQFSQICAGDMLFSCLEAKVGNTISVKTLHGPLVARSARPALPPCYVHWIKNKFVVLTMEWLLKRQRVWELLETQGNQKDMQLPWSSYNTYPACWYDH